MSISDDIARLYRDIFESGTRQRDEQATALRQRENYYTGYMFQQAQQATYAWSQMQNDPAGYIERLQQAVLGKPAPEPVPDYLQLPEGL